MANALPVDVGEVVLQVPVLTVELQVLVDIALNDPLPFLEQPQDPGGIVSAVFQPFSHEVEAVLDIKTLVRAHLHGLQHLVLQAFKQNLIRVQEKIQPFPNGSLFTAQFRCAA